MWRRVYETSHLFSVVSYLSSLRMHTHVKSSALLGNQKWRYFLQDMHEPYKVVIAITLLVVLSLFWTKTLAVSTAFLAAALLYFFNFEYYPVQRRVVNQVIEFSLKVRNSKINDVFANGEPMHNSSNSGLWLKSGYGTLSPNSSSRKMEPKITSTPIPRLHQRRESLLSPRPATGRYSLSDISMSQILPEKDRSRASPVQNTSGPLLASSRYHNSIGTYMDSRSPGLSSRIVQYNREAENRPTHQPKYGRPGVFPIVHLFKKEQSASPKPKTVTLRFAPSDTLPHYSPEQSRLMLNGAFKDPVSSKGSSLLQNTVVTPPTVPENDIGTRSVLDALKEISRKRIHSNEDMEQTLDSCKKQKKDLTPKEQYQKRAREESPQNDIVAKRSCFVVDPVAASATSSQRYRQQLEKGIKRKESLQDHQKEKVLKVNQDVETQTRSKITSPPKATLSPLIIEKATSTEDDKEKKDDKTIERKEEREWVQVFDDRPLAEARKRRLAKMLNSLTGKKPYIEPPKDKSETFAGMKQMQEEEERKRKEEEEKKKSEAELVSILSPPNKTKHDKHVTFNIPSQISSLANVVSSENVITTTAISSISDTKDQTPTSTTNHPVFTLNNTTTATVSAVSSPVTISLSLPSSTILSTVSSTASTPTFSFGKSPTAAATTTTTNSSDASSTSITSPPKIGGFKFDLVASSSSNISPSVSLPTSTTTAPVGAFKIPSSSAFSIPSVKKDDLPKTVSSSFKLPASLSFTSSPSTSSVTFGVNTSTVTSSFAASTAPLFGVNTATVTSASSVAATSGSVSTTPSTFTTPSLVATTSSSGFGSGGFSFGKPTAPVVTTTTTSSSSKPFAFGAGAATSSISKNLFPPADSSVTTTTAAAATAISTAPTFNFGASSTTSPTTTTAGFGLSKSTNNIFSSPSTFGAVSSAPTFGAPATTSSAAVATTTSTFLAFTTAKTTAPSIFANTPATMSSNVFGSTTAAFGAVTTTASVPVFGAASTSSAPIFGATTTTASSVFGAPAAAAPAFGAPTTSAPAFGSAFGGGSTTTTAAPTFGAASSTTTAAPVFGSPFGATTTTTAAGSLFSSAAPAFGAVATNVDTSKSNIFSSGGNSTFGTSQPFGGGFGSGFGTNPVTTAPTFGTAAAAASTAFGSSKQEAPKVFGVPSTPSFGVSTEKQASTFGSSTGTTPTFGTFNATAKPTFGAVNSSQTSNMFASTNPVTPFGSSQQPSFGSNAPQNNSSTFSFGAGAAAGVSTSAATPAAFNFGASTEPPKPGGFNFGATAAPSFGSPQFNAPAAGTFSIGSGAVPNRARTTLRAKRRN